MKQVLFLLTILATTFSYSQESIHFLFTTEGNYQITEPLCTGMIEESKDVMEKEMMKIKKVKKSGEYNIKKAGLKQLANYELMQKLAENPKDYFPIYSPIGDIHREYNDLFENNEFMSLQEVALKELGKPNIQIVIRNVVVSPSTTSLDMDIINLNQAGAPKVSKHFSCATGRLLEYDQEEAQWFFFWQQFYAEVAYKDWLLDELYKINSKLISEKQRNDLMEAKLSELGIGTESYMKERIGILQNKLVGFPMSGLNLDQVKGILMSQDQNKFILYTQQRLPDEHWRQQLGADADSEIQQVALTRIQINAEGEIQCAQLGESIIYSVGRLSYYRNTFYNNALTPFPTLAYNEAQWVNTFFDPERMNDYYSNIVLKHESQSNETSLLLKTFIEPLLNQLVKDTSQYNNYYQRITADNINYYNFDDDTQPTIVKDYLLSNPEKTAYIYPVLLQYGSAQDRDYYYTNEDFKFYVLLRNSSGSYTLYDWHYFKTIPYKNYYNLTNCVESHLTNITDYNSGQEIINDTNFWNNYVYKNSERGYDYLFPIVAQDQSPRIEKAEFDAQVQDCIEILSQYDVKDLYPAQLKQIVLCLNTIQVYNLKGAKAIELDTLSKQLHFKERLNRHMTPINNYYPSLHLEFENDLNAHSYYEF